MMKGEIHRQLASDKEYRLVRNSELGRVLVWTGDETEKQVKVKTSGIFALSTTAQCLDYCWLLQQYLSMNNWNLQIQECKIINKITTNSYKLYLQFKKYSLISLTRWTIVIVTSTIVDRKAYLLIRSCE